MYSETTLVQNTHGYKLNPRVDNLGLYAPVFDANQVSAAHGSITLGVPLGVTSVPGLGFRVWVDQPDPAVVMDGQGVTCGSSWTRLRS